MQKRRKKSTAPESVSHAEDLAQKAAALLFGNDVFVWLGIREKIRQVAPTEGVHMELRHLYEDFNYLMENGQWYHFEFESDRVTRKDLKRFREYEASTSRAYNVDVVTWVICSANVKKFPGVLKTGINQYHVRLIRLKAQEVEFFFGQVKKTGKDAVRKSDLIPIAMGPLLGGTMSMKDRVLEGFRCLKETYSAISREEQNGLQAILYVLAAKFLNREEMQEVKNMAQATLLGQLIWEDGVDEGRKKGIKEGIEKGIEKGIETGITRGRDEVMGILLLDWREDGFSRERILDKLMNRFGLSETEAIEYYDTVAVHSMTGDRNSSDESEHGLYNR